MAKQLWPMFDTIVFLRGEFLHCGDMMTKKSGVFFLNVRILNAKNYGKFHQSIKPNGEPCLFWK
jgi:hypothetical protein